MLHRPQRRVICSALLAVLSLALTLAACAKKEAPAEPAVAAANPIAAGRYLVKIGACNDCHTPGYRQGGDVPESDWLTGSDTGSRGPWGTTYPVNLRLSVQAMDEDQWVSAMHTRKALRPMPWNSINAMSERDLRAIYEFIHWLGPKGVPAPFDQPPQSGPQRHGGKGRPGAAQS
jgi:hypothetical protein